MKFLKEWFSKLSSHMGEDSENNTKGRYLVVARLTSILNVTHYDEVWQSIHFHYIMKENGYGKRKVEVIKGTRDSYYRNQWLEQPRYVKYVRPWELGCDVKLIPSYADIMAGSEPYVA